MARELDGLAVTDLDGAFNANALYVNDNPVQAAAAGNIVLVGDLSSLPVPVGTDIFLADDTLYQFNGEIDIELNTLQYGTNTSIVGIDKRIASIITSTSQIMLDCNGNDLTLRNITISGDTPISCIGESLTIERCNFENYTTGVSVTNTPSMFIDQTAFIDGATALQILGLTNGAVTLNLNRLAGQTIACIDMTGAVIDTFTANVNAFVTGDPGAFAIKGDVADGNGIATNVSSSGFVLGCKFNGSGTSLDGLTKKDVNWDFQSNSGTLGVVNSAVIGGMDQVANATNTVLVTATWVQLAGTFNATGDIERFQLTSNQLVAQVGGEAIMTFSADIEKVGGGVTNEIDFTLFKNGALAGNILRKVDLDVDRGSVTFQNDTDFVVGDVFDIRARRNSGNDDLLISNGTVFLR